MFLYKSNISEQYKQNGANKINEFVKAKTHELKKEYNKGRNIIGNKKLWGMESC